MESNQIIIYSAVILLGLLAGIEGGNIYDNLTSQDTTLEPLRPEGTIISEDPELNSYDKKFSDADSIVGHTHVNKTGPWRVVAWRYAPKGFYEEMNSSAMIFTPHKLGIANAFQFMKLPEEGNMRLVMEGKSGSQPFGLNKYPCDKVSVFVSVNLWKGQIPPRNITEEKLVEENKANKTAVFGKQTERIKMEIPDRFKGEKIVFFGGATDNNPECDGKEYLNILQLEKLYIDRY